MSAVAPHWSAIARAGDALNDAALSELHDDEAEAEEREEAIVAECARLAKERVEATLRGALDPVTHATLRAAPGYAEVVQRLADLAVGDRDLYEQAIKNVQREEQRNREDVL